MLHNVFLKTLWDQRWSLPWWTIGLVALAVITLLFYPFVRDTPLLDELTEWMPEVLLRAFVVPLVLLAYAIVEGTGAIAGEEERGTLDLLLSNPLTRRRVVVEKFAALMGTTLVLAMALWLGMAIGVAIVEMEISLGCVAEANLSVRFLGMTFGAWAKHWCGQCPGIRGLLPERPSTSGEEPRTTDEAITLYYIGANPLTNGLNIVHVGGLIGLAAEGLAVTLVTFEHRDLGV